MTRASDITLGELHDAIATTLLAKITSGEASAPEIQAAIKFLKDNDITSLKETGNKLEQLYDALPKFDEDEYDNVVALKA